MEYDKNKKIFDNEIDFIMEPYFNLFDMGLGIVDDVCNNPKGYMGSRREEDARKEN